MLATAESVYIVLCIKEKDHQSLKLWTMSTLDGSPDCLLAMFAMIVFDQHAGFHLVPFCMLQVKCFVDPFPSNCDEQLKQFAWLCACHSTARCWACCILICFGICWMPQSFLAPFTKNKNTPGAQPCVSCCLPLFEA